MSSDDRRFSLESSRRKLLGAMGGGAVAGLAGCFGSDSAPEDTLRYGLVGQVETFDVPNSSSAEDSIVFNILFGSLTATGADGSIYNWHAQSREVAEVQDVGLADYEPYMREVNLEEGAAVPEDGSQVVVESPNNDPEADTGLALTVNEVDDAIDDGTFGVRVRYELHEGIQFHNGEELTAQHYVNSLERYENSTVAGQTFNDILGYRAVDDYTLDAYAQTPFPEVLRQMPITVFADEQYDLPAGDLDPREGNTPIGTGPYELVDYEDGSYWDFEKFDDFWMEDVGVENKSWGGDVSGDVPNSPNPEKVELEVLLEPSTRTGALQDREIDMTHDLSTEQRNNFADADGFSVETTPQAGFPFMQLPAESPGSPFMEQEVRQAYQHAIPRAEIVERIRQGYSTVAEVPIPVPAGGVVIDDYEQYGEEVCQPLMDGGMERAEELLNEADAEPPISATMITNADDPNRVSLCELTVQTLNDSGLFDLTLETEPDLDALANRAESDDSYEDNEIVMIGIGGGFDPYLYMFVVHSPATYQACCHYQNFGANGGLDTEAILGPLSQTQTIQAVEDLEYRKSLWQDDIIPAVLQQAGNCVTDYEVQSVAVNSREIDGAASYVNPQGMLDYNLYAPYDGVAVEINRS